MKHLRLACKILYGEKADTYLRNLSEELIMHVKITNMAMVRNFGFIYGKFKVIKIRRPVSENCTQKWITELCNY